MTREKNIRIFESCARPSYLMSFAIHIENQEKTIFIRFVPDPVTTRVVKESRLVKIVHRVSNLKPTIPIGND